MIECWRERDRRIQQLVNGKYIMFRVCCGELAIQNPSAVQAQERGKLENTEYMYVRDFSWLCRRKAVSREELKGSTGRSYRNAGCRRRFTGGESEMACNGRVCVGGRTSQARNKRRRGPYLKQNTRPRRDVSAKRKGFMENWGIS